MDENLRAYKQQYIGVKEELDRLEEQQRKTERMQTTELETLKHHKKQVMFLMQGCADMLAS